MRNLKEYIKDLEVNVLKDLLEQYKWETECKLDSHLEKINLIEKELKLRLN
ncbi:hypothetical protein [Clostridium celatum]|uniref:Uncharacterized protein n=1 Tax=Clostridium celatum DSM 1785 TaxID=545697 RepID=L1Q7Y5_9CLOT|nr:hypothetical protein [Clostridium celatum]EKY24078.1 hypothetical protein HMPREF0216_02837 [Clostridium celatum DSM 1785]MCE9656537.1 hypothetical protein [Clostridium celatum]MDU6295551.1 hypothetical protein [Clostridium celatum]